MDVISEVLLQQRKERMDDYAKAMEAKQFKIATEVWHRADPTKTYQRLTRTSTLGVKDKDVKVKSGICCSLLQS